MNTSEAQVTTENSSLSEGAKKSRRRKDRRGGRQKKKPSFLMRILRILVLLIIVIIISLALLIGAGRFYLDTNPDIKLQMTQRVSERFGLPIKTQDINVRWRWAGPQITVDGLQFMRPDNVNSLLEVEQANVVLDLKRFIKTRTLGVSLIELQGTELVLERLANNKLRLNQSDLADLKKLFKTDKEKDINFPNGLFNLRDIALIYNDRVTAQEIRLDNIDLQVDKNDQLLNLQLNIDADQLANDLRVTASTPNPELHDGFEWQVLFESEDLQLTEITQQWQSLRPLFISDSKPVAKANTQAIRFSQGEADVKLWLKVNDNFIQSMNGTVIMDELEFSRGQENLTDLMTDFGLRFSYDHKENFTNLKIDNIRLKTPVSQWPQNNNFQIKLLKNENENTESHKNSIDRVIENKQPAEINATRELNEINKAEVQVFGLTAIERDRQANETKTLIELEINDSDIAPVIKNTARKTILDDLKLAELNASYFSLTDIAPLLEVITKQIPNNTKIPNVNWSQIKGEIQKLSINANARPTAEQPGVFPGLQLENASVIFKDLSIPGINQGPSLSGLNGNINYDLQEAKIVLQSNDIGYNNLDIFRNAIQFETLNTELTLKKENNKWHLHSDNVHLENSDFLINTDVDLIIQKEKSPILELNATVNPKTLENLGTYYPVKIMSPKLLNWLENGVSGGQVSEAKILFKGALSDYPFRNGNGEFLVEHDLSDLNINYAKGWPEALVQQANVVYKNQGFEINATKVKSGELDVFPLTGRFADLKAAILELEINAPVDIQKSRTWINNSPLKDSVGKAIESIHVSGVANSEISMQLPLKQVSDLILQGHLDFSGNPLRLDVLKEPLSNLVGRLEFTKDTITSDNLQAVYLDQLLKTDIKTDNKDIVLDVHTDAELGPLLGENYAKYVDGVSNLDATIYIASTDSVDGGGVKSIVVRSNLLGTGLKLPAPFAKSPDSILPLELNISFNENPNNKKIESLNVSGSVGDALIRSRLNAANVNAAPADREWLLHSLTLVGGDNPDLFASVDASMARINVLGNYSNVNFDEWLEFINEDRDSEVDAALEIGVIDVNLEKMDAIGQSFKDAKVVMLPQANSWKADISNARVDGTINFPRPWTDDSRINADIKKYHMVLPKKGNDEIEFDPKEIPNVSVNIKDFQFENMPLGETSFRMNRKSNGIELQTFNINNSAFSIDGNGGWYNTNEGETSLLTLQLKSNDLVSTLKQLGFAPSASARSAEALIELNWPTSPFGEILPDLSGTVSFKLLNGELREVDPGAGRFLALLSIAQLPKRLSLDFRDVFNSGLQYDELSADFLIQGGQAYTNNMLMKGPVADLGVIGRVGLATRDFDQAAVVQADLGSSLPIAGVLAGGLGVGAAMLIFSEIFKNPLKQATQVFYKIDGNWDDPQINRTPPGELKEVPIAPR